MEDSASTIARLRDLRNMGVQVAIDDFGTGYSSLSYLKRFPVDLLKSDRSFIQALGQGPRESAFARAIIELSRTLRLRSVAEGVETAQQAEESSDASAATLRRATTSRNPSPPTRSNPSSSDPRRSLLHLTPPGHEIYRFRRSYKVEEHSG